MSRESQGIALRIGQGGWQEVRVGGPFRRSCCCANPAYTQDVFVLVVLLRDVKGFLGRLKFGDWPGGDDAEGQTKNQG